MLESFKILTRIGQGHHETDVTIDWTGITEEELKVLARATLVRDLQIHLQTGDYMEFATIIARQQVFYKQSQGPKKEYKIPDSWRSGSDKPEPQAKKKKLAQSESLLQALLLLTPEERKALLG